MGEIAVSYCATSEHDRICESAIEVYEKVLALDAMREDVLKSLGYVSFMINREDRAEIYYRRAFSLDANDPEVLGGLAAIAAHRINFDLISEMRKHEVPMGKPLIHLPSCRELRQRNLSRAEEGIALSTRALEIVTSSELMGYAAWLYRIRADIQCDDPKSAKADMNAAKRWDRMRLKTWKRRTDNHFLRKLPHAPPPPG